VVPPRRRQHRRVGGRSPAAGRPVHDVDLVFDLFEPPERAYAAGIAFLRGQGTGRVQAIRGLDQAQAELGGLVVEVRLPRQGQLPASSYEGEGWVVLRDRSTARVAAGLARLVSIVRVELG
jgi:hypothetical protein